MRGVGRSNKMDVVLIPILEALSDYQWIFDLHIEKYGFNRQMTVLAEECLELSKACLKIKRDIENKRNISLENRNNFHEEFLDVLMMLKQFEYWVSKEDIHDFLDLKINRARERVLRDLK